MFNHSVNNYYVVTFVLEEARLKIGIDPVPETKYVKFQYTQCKSP
jgi:hypothetical protein